MTGCAICGRQAPTTRHHLIPKTRHSNKRNKREFARHEVHATAPVCRACHSQIHAVLGEKELEREFNTVEKLRGHPEVRKFARWIADKPPGFKPKVRGKAGS